MVSAAQDKVGTKLPRIVFHAPEEIKTELEKLAEKRLRSVSNLVRSIVEAELTRAKETGELDVIPSSPASHN